MLWTLITLTCPECIMAMAFLDRFSARHNQKAMKRFAAEDGVDWSLTHAFFANMGGFAVHFPDSLKAPQELADISPQDIPNVEGKSSNSGSVNDRVVNRPPREHCSGFVNGPVGSINPSTPETSHAPLLTNDSLPYERSDLVKYPASALHAFSRTIAIKSQSIGDIDWSVNKTNRKRIIAALGREKTRDPRYDSLDCYFILQGDVWILDAAQLLLAREMGLIRTLPSFHEDQLKDQSKGDFLVKALALLQVTWLVLQVIVRCARHLPITQLEIFVLAFSGPTLLTYILLLSKPHDVKTSTNVRAERHPTPREIIVIARQGPSLSPFSTACIPDGAGHFCGKHGLSLTFLKRLPAS
jgi:hypothetical protein